MTTLFIFTLISYCRFLFSIKG